MKHNYLKHLFTALLLLCTTVATAHNFEVGGIYYNILSKTDKTVEVTCKGSSYSHYSNEYSGSVVIPESVIYDGITYRVTSIEYNAFSYCSGLTSVVIANSVTSIEYLAFDNCTGLTSVEIGNSVTSIGTSAFNACKNLTEIKIPNNVTSIGEYAFSYCSGLTSIEIGTCIGNKDSVTSIGNYAFYGCTGLTSVVFGNNVTSIGNYVFSGCTSLESVKILNSATNIGNAVFGGSSPKKVELNCDTISSWLSRNTSLEEIIIGNSVTSIGEDAFYECTGLTSVEIPNSVTSIGNEAFRGCSGLTSVVIGNSVTSIGSSAFKSCTGLTSVTSLIPTDELFAIYSNVFDIVDKTTCTLYVPYGAKETYAATSGWKDFKNIVEIIGGSCGANVNWMLKDGVLTISGNGAMDDYSRSSLAPWAEYVNLMESIVIEDGVTSIGGWGFYRCTGIKSVEIPKSVTNIGHAAFQYCPGLTNVEIPNSVTSIGKWAFYGCTGLTSVVIPNNVTSIQQSAFYGCTGLTNVEIPNSVTSIGDYAFYGCTGLTSITSLIPAEDLFAIDSDVFSGVDKNACTLCVPYGAKETYATTEGWEDFVNIEGPKVTITINQYGSATYCSPFALDFSEVEGLKAYSAIGFNSGTQVVTLARVMTTPAEAGIFVKGEPGEYIVPIIEECNEHTLNLLVGTLEQTTVNSSDGEMSNYKFTVAELDEAPMFYPFEDNTTFSAGKAYLQIPTAWLPATAQKSVSIRFDEGETTGIDELKGQSGEVKTIYDLQGRVVENPTSGIYIIDGKKVVVK